MSDPELGYRISELERKLAHLYKQLGIAEPVLGEGLSPEVQQALVAGNKIEAIKLQREQTGMDLVQAKAAVESFPGEGGPRIIQ